MSILALPTKFTEILNRTQNIVAARVDQMQKNGLLSLFDCMLELINDFTLELQIHTTNLISPAESTGINRKADWNDRLGLHMLGIVVSQYVFAFSHFCRAQPSEIYVHMRRAIEAAGVAYTAISDVDLANLYGSDDEKRFWPRIKRDKILPTDNPLTAELNSMMKQASTKLHSNLQSIASSLHEAFEFRDSYVDISVKIRLNNLNPDEESVWQDCSYILNAMYYICKLFAERYDLPKSPWHDRLERYRSDILRIDSLLKSSANQSRAS